MLTATRHTHSNTHTATHTRAECHYLNFRPLLEPQRDDGKKKILLTISMKSNANNLHEKQR